MERVDVMRVARKVKYSPRNSTNIHTSNIQMMSLSEACAKKKCELPGCKTFCCRTTSYECHHMCMCSNKSGLYPTVKC
ncbi:hypothetical protein LSAT2_004609 [Lamellibrachia satsuma]|nr:hypothetical protein LSAT2_004609 [Lamellibrachia satsuma]